MYLAFLHVDISYLLPSGCGTAKETLWDAGIVLFGWDIRIVSQIYLFSL
jgi:hypothetical protein